MSAGPDFAALGQVSAELLHDLQGTLGVLRDRAAHLVHELEAGVLPVQTARDNLRECEEVQGMVADVVAAVAGKRPPAPFYPAAVTEREVGRTLQRGSAVEIRLHTAVPRDLVVAGRESFLRRAVGNLLRNATRHATSRIEVDVLAHSADGVQIFVEDDGPGIPEEIRGSLFDAGVHGEHGGSGLGLASVRWAVQQLGGWVGVAEPAVLGGARFELWLPAARLTPESPPSPSFARSLEGRTVAVIDDDPAVRRTVQRLLERQGATVVAFGDEDIPPEGGWPALAAVRPDAVLLDLHLGAASGIALWHRLRATEPEIARRVAFFSGAGEWGSPDGALAETGRPTIQKGLGIAELVAEVDRLIRDAAVAGEPR